MRRWLFSNLNHRMCSWSMTTSPTFTFTIFSNELAACVFSHGSWLCKPRDLRQDDLRQYALLGASAVVSKHDIDQVCRVVSSCCIDDSLAKIRVN